jgi:hypothetical protein
LEGYRLDGCSPGKAAITPALRGLPKRKLRRMAT